MGIFFDSGKLKAFNELQRVAKDGTVEDISGDDEDEGANDAPPAEEPEAPPEPSAEEKLLTEIRDLLKK